MVSLDDKSALLIYRIGPVYCCSPSFSIENISIPGTLTHPPGTDTAHPGIFKYGNHIVSVSDLRFQFGVTEADWQQPGRMVITELTKTHIGFWVDEIIDVIQFPESGWGSLPAQLPRGIFSRTLLLKDRIYLYAEFEKLQTLQGGGYLHQYISKLEEQQNKTLTQNVSEKQAAAHNEDSKTKPSSESPSETQSDADAKTKPVLKSKIDPSITDKTAQKEIEPVANVMATTKPVTPQATTEKQNSIEKKVVSEKTPAVLTKPTTISKPGLATDSTSTTSLSKQTVLTDKSQSSPIAKKMVVNKSVRQTTNKMPATSSITTAEKSSSGKTGIKQQSVNTAQQPPQTNNKSNGLLGLILFFIIITGGGFAGYYFLIEQPEKEKLQIQTSVYTPAVTQYYVEPAKKEIIISETIKTEHVEPLTPVVTSPATEKPQEFQSITEPQTALSESATDNNKYHASIEEDKEGITIILNAPKTAELDLRSEVAVKNISIEPTDKSINNLQIKEETPAKPEAMENSDVKTPAMANQPQKIVTIHIVVKGDTLWHIARRYVDDPFLYPELARLSNIKNPHRIYPGNRVRIIRYLN